MADVSELLSNYLAAICRRRWQPGAFDCAVFMADWVRELTGLDPIADVRGTYHTEQQFLRIVRREGGFEAAVGRRLGAVGFCRVGLDARAGDMAVVLAPYAVRRGRMQSRPTGAIAVDQDRCAVVTSDLGLVIAPLPTRAVYRHG